MGLDDLRGGIEQTRQRLAAEQRELETVRRRKGLAAGINDQETVQLAEKYEVLHAERTDVLTRKLAVQESELAMVEREVAEMTTALKSADVRCGRSAAAAPNPRRRSSTRCSTTAERTSRRRSMHSGGRVPARRARRKPSVFSRS